MSVTVSARDLTGFEQLIDKMKEEKGVKYDVELTADDLKTLAEQFIMMGSLTAVADNDTYFFSKVDYGSVFVVQTADGFLYQIILIGRIFFRCGVVRRRQRLAVSRMGIGKNERGGILGLCELVVK